MERLARRVHSLVESARTVGGEQFLEPEDLETHLELEEGALDEAVLWDTLEDLFRLESGGLRPIQNRDGWSVGVRAGASRNGWGDALAALARFAARGPLLVTAETLTRWCGRIGTKEMPPDLAEDLRGAAPRFGLELGLPTGFVWSKAFVSVRGPVQVTAAPASPASVPHFDSTEPGAAALLRFTSHQGWRSPEQRELIGALLDEGGPRDVLGVLPTSGGKSLGYVLPTLAWTDGGRTSGLTLVVSPLIALMNDQVRQVDRRYVQAGSGFVARQLNSSLSPEERRNVHALLRAGSVHLLYVSPETLLQPAFLHDLESATAPVRLLVVDEAHMVQEWGEDFRCEYQRLGSVRERFRARWPALRTLLLTATLTDCSRAAVLDALRFPPEARVIERRTLRSELCYEVRRLRPEEKAHALLQLLPSLERPGIVYCTRRETCHEVQELLAGAGCRSVQVYHGRTPTDTRGRVLADFQGGALDVVVATNAFGLGVDKADVRFVVHFEVPGSPDRYYQEVGRAGRDGRPARAVLLYSPSDLASSRDLAIRRLDTAKVVDRWQTLAATAAPIRSWAGRPGNWLVVNDALVPQYARTADAPEESDGHHRAWNHVALNLLERARALRVESTVIDEARIRRGRDLALGERAGAEVGAVRAALPASGDTVTVQLVRIATETGLDLRDLERALLDLWRSREIELELPTETAVVVEIRGDLVRARESLANAVAARRAAEKARVAGAARAVQRFASGVVCREVAIGEVYGISGASGCGRCDVCRDCVASDAQGEHMRPPKPDKTCPRCMLCEPDCLSRSTSDPSRKLAGDCYRIWAHAGKPARALDHKRAEPIAASREPQKHDRIRESLAAIEQWYSAVGRPALALRVSPAQLELLESQLRNARSRADGAPKVQVALFGTTGAGKSTLVNAVLETNLLPTSSIGSTTAAQVVVRFGPTRRVTVSYEARDVIEAKLEELRRAWADSEIPGVELGGDEEALGPLRSIARNVYGFPQNHSFHSLSEIEGPIPDPIADLLGTTKEFTRDVQDTIAQHVAGRFSAITREVTVEFPAPILARGLQLVDLPGTGDIDEARVAATRRYVSGTDQFVVVAGPKGITTDLKPYLKEYGLLKTLLESKERPPLIVLGTKLDAGGPAKQEDIVAREIDPGLPWIRQAEELWALRIKEEFSEHFIRPLVEGLVGSKDPAIVEQARAERIGQLAAHFFAVNPRAAVELNDTTRDPRTTKKDLEHMQAQYPDAVATGLPRVRKILEDVSDRRYRDYWEDVARIVRALHGQLAGALDAAAKELEPAKRNTTLRESTAKLEDARRRATAGLEVIRAGIQESYRSWVDLLVKTSNEGSDLATKHGANLVRNHLKPMHWQSLRAAVQPARAGVWVQARISIPSAVFPNVENQLADRWRQHVANALVTVAKSLADWQAARLEDLLAIAALDPGSAKDLQAAARRLIELLGEEVRQDEQRARERHGELEARVTRPVQELVKAGFRPGYAEAAAERGKGVKDRMIADLAGTAPRSADHVRDSLPESLRERGAEMRDLLERELVDGPEDAVSKVFDEFERILRLTAEAPATGSTKEATETLEKAKQSLSAIEPVGRRCVRCGADAEPVEVEVAGRREMRCEECRLT